MKIIVSFLSVILIVTNTVLLLFQYEVYSSSLDEQEQAFSYEQEIELTIKKDKIVVDQHFYHLPEEAITIVWPAVSTSRSCHSQLNDSCERLAEDLASFTKGELVLQSISYEIPIEEAWNKQVVIKDFTATLKNGEVSYTTLHITDQEKRGGMWVTGLPALGNTSLDLIDYTLAFGEGDISEIYWQQKQLPVVYQNKFFTIYSEAELAEGFTDLLDELQFTKQEHLSVLMSDKKVETDVSNILFLQNNDLATMQKELIFQNIASQYDISPEKTLLPEIVSSFLVGRPMGAQKTVWMYEVLTDYFTTDQLAVWNNGLTKLKKIDEEKLDLLLSEVLKLKTSFFTANVEQDGKFPLLFEDSRRVSVNGDVQQDIQVLFKDGKVLYKAYPLLDSLTYSYRNTQDKGLYVESETRAFRFPVEEPFYVYNQKRYDAFSSPFETVGSELYVEEAWMMRLFLLDIQKEEKVIRLTERTSF